VGAANAAALATMLHSSLGFAAGRKLSHVLVFDNTLHQAKLTNAKKPQ